MQDMIIFRFEHRLYDVDVDAARRQNMVVLPDRRVLIIQDWVEIAKDLHRPSVVVDSGMTFTELSTILNQEEAVAIPVAEAVR